VSNHKRVSSLATLIFAMCAMALATSVFADDKDDVMAIVYKYGDLENDLESQAKLMRPDRVYITGGMRQTDEARNMANQIATRKAGEALNGGKTKFVTTIEGPLVSVHGNVAIASFVRWWNVYPHNQPSVLSTPTWVTLVLIKEGNDWLIKHTHQSPLRGN